MTRPPQRPYIPPENNGLDILFEDRTLLVVEKPAGLLSVPGRGEDKQDSLARRVQRIYPEAEIVHRLDMDTSGLLLMARGKTMQTALGRLFQDRQIEKHYVALVAGRVMDAQGVIELPLITDWLRRPLQKVDRVQGKRAITYYRVLEYDAECDTSRMLLSPQTGRSHQLRVHMQQLGHPILGDRLYGGGAGASRLCLHASELRFRHPDSGRELHFQSAAAF